MVNDASSVCAGQLPPAVPLTVRVGFIGERIVDEQVVSPLIDESFKLLVEALRRVSDAPTRRGGIETLREAHAILGAGDAVPRLTLFTGYAPGSDRVAAKTWLAMRRDAPQLGATHALLQFIDPERPDEYAWTDVPGIGAVDSRVDIHPSRQHVFDTVTVLDGGALSAEFPAVDPHLEHARWITRWSDVLVAVWNGRPAAGNSVTMEAVLFALQRGIPILWIDTSQSSAVLRLLRMDAFWSDSSNREILASLADPAVRERIATRELFAGLCDHLVEAFVPPDSAASQVNRIAYAESDSYGFGPPHFRTSPFARLRYLMNRSRSTLIADAWQRFDRALATSEPLVADSAPAVPELIAAHAASADQAATFSGNLHRGTQAAFLLAAVASVLLGTLPALFMDVPKVSHSIKHWSVPAEAILLTVVLGVWGLDYFTTSHNRWSDCRRLAERLRCLRATWPLGFDVADRRSDHAQTWTEWQARAIRRAIGPPTGVVSMSKMRSELGVLRTDPKGIIMGQAAYNAVTSARLHRLHDWLVRIEMAAFAFLLLFLAVYAICDLLHLHVTHVIAGPLVVASAVVPTVCAACLALDAKLGIEENYLRSKKLAAEFAVLDERIASVSSIPEGIELVRDAGRLLLSDVDAWQDAAVRRKIVAL